MTIPTPTIVSAISTVVSSLIALAVSFSVTISTGQQAAILGVVAGVGSLVTLAIAYFEGKKVTAQAVIASAHTTAAQSTAAAAKVLR